LYQKGAQKIVGVEFGASVALAMKESIICASFERSGMQDSMMFPAERGIGFTCIDSFFFSEFDGEWRLVETMVDGECCTMHRLLAISASSLGRYFTVGNEANMVADG
jgi:hypothetical protein